MAKRYESNINIDVLIISCLLHDIGRQEQFENSKLCHAQVGSKKAYNYLINNKFCKKQAMHVKSCISTHRFRSDNPPDSIEAKILFDADKLDATGTLGIARTLFYNAQVSEPLYSLDKRGHVLDGSTDKMPSFFQEYKYKLENLYNKFYTNRAIEIAKKRQYSAIAFYSSMLKEVQECYKHGINQLESMLK